MIGAKNYDWSVAKCICIKLDNLSFSSKLALCLLIFSVQTAFEFSWYLLDFAVLELTT